MDAFQSLCGITHFQIRISPRYGSLLREYDYPIRLDFWVAPNLKRDKIFFESIVLKRSVERKTGLSNLPENSG